MFRDSLIRNFVVGFAGLAVLLIGFGLLLYLTIWIMFIGGIADAINLLKSPYPVSLGQVGFTLGKIFLAFPVLMWLGSGIGELSDSFDTKPWEESSWLKMLMAKDCKEPDGSRDYKANSEIGNNATTEFDWALIPSDWAHKNRQGEIWTKEEDELLLAAISSGGLVTDIASRHGRSIGAIERRILRLHK